MNLVSRPNSKNGPIWSHWIYGVYIKPGKEYRSTYFLFAATSVTRSGDLLDFGQLLKPLATINLPKSPTFFGNFCTGVKNLSFSSEIIFEQFL